MNPEVTLKIEAIDNTKDAFKSVERSISGVEKTTKGFRENLEKLQPAFQKMVTVGTVALGAVAYGANRAIESASKLEESINAVNVVFGTGADEILAFGQNSAKSVGMSTSAFNQMATITGALLKDTGLSMDDVAGKTNDLTARAADMASVFNTDVNDAMSAINQAIRGETEAIRRYAGDVTDASLQTYLLSQGIQTNVTDLTEQEKRLYRVDLIMAQTNVTAGDFANTSDSLANRQRILSAETENLSAKMGKLLAPIKELLLNAISPMIEKIGVWIEKNPELAKTIVILTGVMSGFVLVVGALGIALNILISPVTLIIAALASLAGLVYIVVKKWEALPLALKIVLGPLKLVTEAFQMLFKVLGLVGEGIGWVYDKITNTLGVATVKAQHNVIDLSGAMAGLVDPMAWQNERVTNLGSSIGGLGNSAKEAADKIQQLKDEAQGIFGNIDKDEADSKRKLAETIVDQEESISSKKSELRKLQRAEDTDSNATRINELRRTISEEEAALLTANDFRVQLRTEIDEAERRASLSDFERKVEDIQRERASRLQGQVARLQEIQQEILAEQMKNNAISNSFGNAQTTMQNAIKKTSEIAVSEAEKMQKAFDRAVSSMSQLNIAGSSRTSLSISSKLKYTKVDDAVIAPTGDVVSTHPDDWLIATKNPSALAGGGGITINISGTFMNDREAARRVGNEIMNTLKQQTRIA